MMAVGHIRHNSVWLQYTGKGGERPYPPRSLLTGVIRAASPVNPSWRLFSPSNCNKLRGILAPSLWEHDSFLKKTLGWISYCWSSANALNAGIRWEVCKLQGFNVIRVFVILVVLPVWKQKIAKAANLCNSVEILRNKCHFLTADYSLCLCLSTIRQKKEFTLDDQPLALCANILFITMCYNVWDK